MKQKNNSSIFWKKSFVALLAVVMLILAFSGAKMLLAAPPTASGDYTLLQSLKIIEQAGFGGLNPVTGWDIIANTLKINTKVEVAEICLPDSTGDNCKESWAEVGGGNFDGSGAANSIAKFVDNDTLGDSVIKENATRNVSISANSGHNPDSNYDISTRGIIISDGTNGVVIGDGSPSSSSGQLKTDGAIWAEWGVSTYDFTVPENSIEAGQFCLGNGGGDCITDWPEPPSEYSPAVVVGATSNIYQGDQDGYTGANSLCGGEAHICTTDEVMYSINNGINLIFLPNISSGGFYWVSGGIPFPSGGNFMNDCFGWNSSSSSAGAIAWYVVDGEVAGNGTSVYANFCNASNAFLCCQ